MLIIPNAYFGTPPNAPYMRPAHMGEGDDLRIFPGPFEGEGRVAAPWVPDDSLASQLTLVARLINAIALQNGGYSDAASKGERP